MLLLQRACVATIVVETKSLCAGVCLEWIVLIYIYQRFDVCFSAAIEQDVSLFMRRLQAA